MDERILKIRRLRSEGLSVKQTAEATGYSASMVKSVNSWAKRFEEEWELATALLIKRGDVETKPEIIAAAIDNARKHNDAGTGKKHRDVEIKELLTQGLTLRQIKDLTGIEFAQVKSVMYWPAWFAMEWEDAVNRIYKYYGREPIGQEKRQA